MVADAVKSAAAILEKAGVETPRLDAEILLAFTLNCSRLDIIAHPERRISKDESRRYAALVEKRAFRCPLAYLVGCREFHGLQIRVSPDVLVPRPETELLVEQTIRRIGPGPALIADVGTGSGAIAVALAANLPEAVVFGTDISAAALKVARLNVDNHHLAERVRLLEGDLAEPLAAAGLRFDAVVSNPPYIPGSEIAHLQPEVSRWEPRAALDGGPDGLDVIRRLLPGCLGLLKSEGFAALEIGEGQAGPVEDVAREAGYSSVETINDYSGIPRIVVCCVQSYTE